MPDKDGVEIYKRFYPWPDRFRLGDPVLVKEVTAMRWPDFVAALDELDEDEAPDQVVLAGLIAVAFWQGNPQMSRDKARRAVERIPQDEIEIVVEHLLASLTLLLDQFFLLPEGSNELAPVHTRDLTHQHRIPEPETLRPGVEALIDLYSVLIWHLSS